MAVIQGGRCALRGDTGATAPTPLRRACERFLLEQRALDRQLSTLVYYEQQLRPFLSWLENEHPAITRLDDVDKDIVIAYRVHERQRAPRRANARSDHLQKATLQASQRALRTFFGWAERDGYAIDRRILSLEKTRLPVQEADVFHVVQVRAMLAATRNETEDLLLRILLASGARRSEVGPISTRYPGDGLGDLQHDSIDRGHGDLRLRWDGGTKGMKTRRVPVPPRLVSRARRYEAHGRPDVRYHELLIHEQGRPYTSSGVDSVMDRIQRRVGFRVHAHAFRHTFGTVGVQLGWHMERLRVALGHEDYKTVQRYIRMASVRDLGRQQDWLEFVANPPPGAAPSVIRPY
jgi:site-specific recombinase XerD